MSGANWPGQRNGGGSRHSSTLGGRTVGGGAADSEVLPSHLIEGSGVDILPCGVGGITGSSLGDS